MTRILLAEDEERLAATLAAGLREEEYVVDRMGRGDEALWCARGGMHDLMILDLRLPGMSGLEVCRRLRAEGAGVPILMLTACDTVEDVVRGLDAGANDYLTKPFAFAELVARIRALVRAASAARAARFRVGDIEIDSVGRRVWRGGEELHLRRLEYRLLEQLARHAGTVQTRRRLIAAAWEDEIGPDSNALEVHMSRLRRKIDRGRERPLIRTERGVGYTLLLEGP